MSNAEGMTVNLEKKAQNDESAMSPFLRFADSSRPTPP
jgi:hypothetical protein